MVLAMEDLMKKTCWAISAECSFISDRQLDARVDAGRTGKLATMGTEGSEISRL